MYVKAESTDRLTFYKAGKAEMLKRKRAKRAYKGEQFLSGCKNIVVDSVKSCTEVKEKQN